MARETVSSLVASSRGSNAWICFQSHAFSTYIIDGSLAFVSAHPDPLVYTCPLYMAPPGFSFVEARSSILPERLGITTVYGRQVVGPDGVEPVAASNAFIDAIVGRYTYYGGA